jgi:hypothetical protein
VDAGLGRVACNPIGGHAAGTADQIDEIGTLDPREAPECPRPLIPARRDSWFKSKSGSLQWGPGPFWAYILENRSGRFYVGSTAGARTADTRTRSRASATSLASVSTCSATSAPKRCSPSERTRGGSGASSGTTAPDTMGRRSARTCGCGQDIDTITASALLRRTRPMRDPQDHRGSRWRQPSDPSRDRGPGPP